MRLAGLQKVTLLDYPGEIACTVFTKGCNLRCPFCHNPELVLTGSSGGEEGMPSKKEGSSSAEEEVLPEEVFFDYLDRRRGRLSAVVVSGGEPTLHADLPVFLRKIREMGFLVKLDTNGLTPNVLRGILDQKLADYVAMDVKNSPGKYAMTCGLDQERLPDLWERVSRSISLLSDSPVACEFRTTVVKGLHTEEDILEMAKLLPPHRPWYLQQFTDTNSLVGDVTKPGLILSPPTPLELEKMRAVAAEIIPGVSVRGT